LWLNSWLAGRLSGTKPTWPEEAVRFYTVALALRPGSPAIVNNLGAVLLDGKGKVDEALACFHKAIALDHKYALAYRTLGATWHARGMLDRARACFQRASELVPRDARAHGALGQTLMRQGHFSEAQLALRRCLALLPAGHPLRAPTSGLLQQCRQHLDMDGKLRAFLAGKGAPADAAAQVQMAGLAQQPFNQLNVTAARLYRDAFARVPRLADAHRYNAACAAVLAGTSQGKDAGRLGPSARRVWRKQALAWLQADLAARRKQLKSKVSGQAVQARQTLEHWQRSPALAGVREVNKLARLPAEECEAWLRLWVEVARTLQQTD
jgi:Tfp pilus assembly protein PilF